ncbi:hypothetical protein J28TS4_11570 [Paenibacillus lautus]|nr:hypothetical protein J28TS4_11570 [Paenibacillus lautus]
MALGWSSVTVLGKVSIIFNNCDPEWESYVIMTSNLRQWASISDFSTRTQSVIRIPQAAANRIKAGVHVHPRTKM